ncbi:MAG: YetF domain-containing protein [Erythrobacter sp.]
MFVSQTDLDVILRGLILGAIALVWVVALIRITGLRSLSKMTNFDFVMTVALGSLVAGGAQATDWNAFLQVVAGMAAMFITQVIAARLRKSSDTVENMMSNNPQLLMRNGEILHDALKKCRVAESDLIAKLREANVLSMSEVRAVVLETTGDVSVLHGDQLDDRLLANVTCEDKDG